MYWLLFSLSFCCLFLGTMTASTTTSTMMPTTTRASHACIDHTCYSRGCLAADILNNSTGMPCNTPPQGYCAIHIVSNTSYYEVTASCETSCQSVGNRESATATYCCIETVCNDDENKLPEPPENGAGLLSLKWQLVFAVEAIVVFLPILTLG